MEPSKPNEKKKALLITGIVIGVLLVLVLAAVLFINGKFSLLNRSASYGTSSLTPGEEELSFEHLNLDDIDIMKNGRQNSIAKGDDY